MPFLSAQHGNPVEAGCCGEGDGPNRLQGSGDPGQSEVLGRPEPPHHEERQGARPRGRHPHPARVRERSQEAALKHGGSCMDLVDVEFLKCLLNSVYPLEHFCYDY
jgi:hypothetical protein